MKRLSLSLTVTATADHALAPLRPSPVTFMLDRWGVHDYVLLTPAGWLYWPQINQQLGIAA